MSRIPRNVLSERGIWEPKISEAHVARSVDELLALNKAEFYVIRERIPYCPHCKRRIARASQSGIPDRIGYFPPRTVEFKGIKNESTVHFRIELKRPKGLHRVMQDVEIRKDRNHGIIAFFCESREQMVTEFEKCGLVLWVS